MPWKPHTALWELPLVTARPADYSSPSGNIYAMHQPHWVTKSYKYWSNHDSWHDIWRISIEFFHSWGELSHWIIHTSTNKLHCTVHLGIGYVYAFCQCMMTACPLPHTHRQLSKAVLRRTWLLGFPHSETRLHTPWSCMYRRRKSPTVSI